MHDKNARKKIIEKALEISSLPVLLNIAMEVMSISEDDNRSMKQISELISNDPSLVAGVLKVANSAFYGLKKSIGTLDSALVIMGLREIKNIVFMMGIFKFFPDDKEFNFDKIDYLNHSILTAATAAKLSRTLKIDFKSSPFICGLLHDIGKIFLYQHSHDDFIQVIKESKSKNIFMHLAEINILGIDHAKLGYLISKKWNFPDEITEAIRLHHAPIVKTENDSMASIIQLANLLANFGKTYIPSVNWNVGLKESPEWKMMKQSSALLKKLEIKKLLFDLVNDIENTREIINIYSSRFSK